MVHYRVGSLEIATGWGEVFDDVHYRVGSLETALISKLKCIDVHYRVGSKKYISGGIIKKYTAYGVG